MSRTIISSVIVLSGVQGIVVGVSSAAYAQSLRAVTPKQTETSVMADLTALDGAMPSSFDLYPADLCAGVWDVQGTGPLSALKISVFRYRNVSLMHVSAPGFAPSNQITTRLDPHSIKANHSALSVVLRCTMNHAVAEFTPTGGRTMIFNLKPGVPEGAAAMRASAPPAIEPEPVPEKLDESHATVREVDGNIRYADPNGAVHQLTHGGNDMEPVLAPDGHTVAFTHFDHKPKVDETDGRTSLWIGDITTGITRRLLTPRSDDDPKRNLDVVSSPHFSLDGGYVYIDADAWMTSPAVHQVNVATGEERYVVDGTVKAVIRTGPYRGYLIVAQHHYAPEPRKGFYDPVHVVRPDGKEELLIPGTDLPDPNDERDDVGAWLKQHGWQAW